MDGVQLQGVATFHQPLHCLAIVGEPKNLPPSATDAVSDQATARYLLALLRHVIRAHFLNTSLFFPAKNPQDESLQALE
ncbi:hypothetical protein DLJ88_08000 [Evtepia gabavorous]|uniref:Uncharacterized protein n=1 Tax=Evtepia gabavorous TaxID=2211183 RepID=A0A3E2B2R0_9FIRM|nr:hypothetical protein DV520_08000 [Evtepia gabavorous]TYK62558.1 hypothetical protein DLJ88_08000 [Evtepia gabavorous]